MPRDVDDDAESEYGLGPGLLGVDNRENRLLDSNQELMEIYALPKTFGGSMPERPKPEDTPVPRLLPGETESDRQ